MHLSFISLFTLAFTASFLLHVSLATKAVECLAAGAQHYVKGRGKEEAWLINSLRAEIHYNVSA
jgi:hypothetical protein